MGLKINKQTNLEKLFDEFAIDPTNKDNDKSPKGKANTKKEKNSNKNK